MLNITKDTHYILEKAGCFLRMENDPPKRDSGFLLRRRVMSEFMLASFMCFGNRRGFFRIY